MLTYMVVQSFNEIIYGSTRDASLTDLFLEAMNVSFQNWDFSNYQGFWSWFMFIYSIVTMSIMLLSVIISVVGDTY